MAKVTKPIMSALLMEAVGLMELMTDRKEASMDPPTMAQRTMAPT